MKLTATKVKQAKPTSKQQKLYDGRGLYLLLHPNGGKYWRAKYRFGGKEKSLSLGTYPDISLARARELHQNAREMLANGIDPGQAAKAQKLSHSIAAANTFEAVAREWFNVRMQDKSESHKKRTIRSLEKDLFPSIGSFPISEITAPTLLSAIRKIEKRGVLETARRALQTSGQIFRYAIASGRAERDVSADLRGALQTPKKSHHPAIIDPAGVANLLKAINGYTGTPAVRAALRLSPLLFQRPGEIRSMEWQEINWDENRWEIPATKMKMGQPHIVPLSHQAIAILSELEPITRRSKYVFPSARGASRCLSDNAVRTALRSLGYDNDTMTPHGFRAMARTLLDEVLGYRIDWIEHQLAHAVRDPNGRAYNRTAHLSGRTEMMQGWADYLDKLQGESDEQ